MPSLASYYTPPTGNTSALLASNNVESGLATTQAGLDTTRATRDFADITMPGLVNNAAASGDFYGGMLGHQADMAKRTLNDQVGAGGDIQNALNQKLADLRRSGILAATGVSL